MLNNTTHNLISLDEHSDDWQVTEEGHDPRGWNVIDRNNNSLGEIEDLLINADTKEAVFAVVDQRPTFGSAKRKKILIPLKQLELYEAESGAVYTGSADPEESPLYDRHAMDFDPFYEFWNVEPEAAKSIKEKHIRVYVRKVEPERVLRPGEQAVIDGEPLVIPIVEEEPDDKPLVVTEELVIEPETEEDEVRKETTNITHYGSEDVDEEDD